MRPIGILLAFGLSLTATCPNAAADASPPRGEASEPSGIARHVTDASQRFGIPASWIEAVIRVESGGELRAISRAGAMGLMQLMPATWASLREQYGLGTDPFDARDNIMAGAALLRVLHDRYGAPGFLAAYNAGPGRYEEYLRGGRNLPRETVAYLDRLVPAVMGSIRTTRNVEDPLAWTRAPLFAGAIGSATNSARTTEVASIAPLPGPTTGAQKALTETVDPQPATLFVSRAGPDKR